MTLLRRILILAALVFAFGMLDGLFARQEQEFLRAEQARALEKKAELYATVISTCANGGRFSLGDDTEILCRQRPIKRGSGL